MAHFQTIELPMKFYVMFASIGYASHTRNVILTQNAKYKINDMT